MNQSHISAKKISIPVFDPAPGEMVLEPATKRTRDPAPGASCLQRRSKSTARACANRAALSRNRLQDPKREQAHRLQEQPADREHASGVRVCRRLLLLDTMAGPRLCARHRQLYV